MCKAGWFSAIHLQAWSCMFSDPAEWCNCQVEPIHSISPMARWQRLHFRASKKSICWTISCSWVGCSDATMELFGLHLLGQLVLIHRFVSPSLLMSAVWRDLRPVTCIGFVIGSVKIILKSHGHSNPGLSGLRNASWLAVPNFPTLLRTRLFDHCLQWLGSPVGCQEGSISEHLRRPTWRFRVLKGVKANLILAHRACTGKLDCQRLPSFLQEPGTSARAFSLWYASDPLPMLSASKSEGMTSASFANSMQRVASKGFSAVSACSASRSWVSDSEFLKHPHRCRPAGEDPFPLQGQFQDRRSCLAWEGNHCAVDCHLRRGRLFYQRCHAEMEAGARFQSPSMTLSNGLRAIWSKNAPLAGPRALERVSQAHCIMVLKVICTSHK